MINPSKALEVAVVAGVLAGCGGQSGGPKLDPAATDFCLQFSNELCRMAYVCYFEEERDAAFQAQYGVDIAACQDDWYKKCIGKLPAGTSGPSCGRGKTVIEAAATACVDRFANNLMCAEWEANPTQGCETACSGSVPHNDAGASDGGLPGHDGGGIDAGGSDAHQPGTDAGGRVDAGGSVPATAVEFCNAFWNVACEKSIECGDTQASLEECESLAPLMCSDASCSAPYDASQAAACLTATRGMSCSEYESTSGPPSCGLACP